MNKKDRLLQDLDKRQHLQVDDPSAIPDGAIYEGVNEEGNDIYSQDADGDGLIDTIIEVVSNFF